MIIMVNPDVTTILYINGISGDKRFSSFVISLISYNNTAGLCALMQNMRANTGEDHSRLGSFINTPFSQQAISYYVGVQPTEYHQSQESQHSLVNKGPCGSHTYSTNIVIPFKRSNMKIY